MALSNAEKQRRYRSKIRTGELHKFEIVLGISEAVKFAAIAEHWDCTKTEAFRKLLDQAYLDMGEPDLTQT